MGRMFDVDEVIDMVDEKIEDLDALYQQAEFSGDHTQLMGERFRRLHGSMAAWECVREFINDIAVNYDDVYDKGYNDGYKLGFTNGKKHMKRFDNEID